MTKFVAPRFIGGAVVAALLIAYALAGWTSLDAGQVGVLLKQYGSDRGMQKETLGPGTHWIEPFEYDVYVYDTRFVQKEQAATSQSAIPANSADGQPIEIDVSFQVGLDPNGVPALHQNVGRDWWNAVVLPLVRSTVRTEASRVRSEDIYTGAGRETIQKAVEGTLQERLSQFGIVIETNLRDIRFDNKQFVDALNAKAIAEQQQEINKRQAAAAIEAANRDKNIAEGARYQVEQQAQGQRYVVEQQAAAKREQLRLEGEGERLQKEEQAKGVLAIAQAEAEGTRLRNAALSGAGGRNLVEIEWAHSLGPKMSVVGIPINDKSALIFTDALKSLSLNASGGN